MIGIDSIITYQVTNDNNKTVIPYNIKQSLFELRHVYLLSTTSVRYTYVRISISLSAR